MISFPLVQPDGTGADVPAQVRQVVERREALVRATLRSGINGTVGIVVRIPGYDPYFRQGGSSPAIVDNRGLPRVAGPPTVSKSYRDALALPVAQQAREMLAALSLNKSQLAAVLGVSRPTLYDWLDGKEPSAPNVDRITLVLRVLARAGVSSATPLNARFVRHAVSEQGPSLLEALCAETLDEEQLAKLVADARSLDAVAQARQRSRDERLRALGYDEPSDEDAKATLAKNIAMRDWPKR